MSQLRKRFGHFVAGVGREISRQGYRIESVAIRRAGLLEEARSALPPPKADRLGTASVDQGIVITTFELRLTSHCLPLIAAIRRSGVEDPIFVVVNGNLDGTINERLRREFVTEVVAFQPLGIVTLQSMHGMSHNWNLGIRLLDAAYTLVLSDDLEIDEKMFRFQLDQMFQRFKNDPLVVINDTFASFLFSDEVREQVGLFDEFFVGFGEEDGDYCWRYESAYGCAPTRYRMTSLRHLNEQTRGQERPGRGKYSLANSVFLGMKYTFGLGNIRGMFGDDAELNLDTPNPDPNFNLRRVARLILNSSSTLEIEQLLEEARARQE